MPADRSSLPYQLHPGSWPWTPQSAPYLTARARRRRRRRGLRTLFRRSPASG
jgi:hypothetical protein